MALTTSKQRDFVRQMISTIAQNEQRINATGFNLAPKQQALNEKAEAVDIAVANQKKVQAEALEATENANKLLEDAYTEASALVELLAGALGKNDALVQEIRKLRKTRTNSEEPQKDKAN